MDKEQGKGSAPPYVPYRTLLTFLERFKQGVPNRIGTDLMRTMSGGTRSQLLTSLKSFGLINDAGVPQDRMKKLCGSEGADRQRVVKDLIEACYPYLFKDGFEFSTTTHSLLREAIQANTVANGETVVRCIAFLKDAATDAGIPVSPFLKEQQARGPAKPRKTKPRLAGSRREDDEVDLPEEELDSTTRKTQPQIAAQSSLLLWGLFQRLPKPGTVWPKVDRDQWTVALNNIIALEYPDK
jgi:uncharacterized protein DUF5343